MGLGFPLQLVFAALIRNPPPERGVRRIPVWHEAVAEFRLVYSQLFQQCVPRSISSLLLDYAHLSCDLAFLPAATCTCSAHRPSLVLAGYLTGTWQWPNCTLNWHNCRNLSCHGELQRSAISTLLTSLSLSSSSGVTVFYLTFRAG